MSRLSLLVRPWTLGVLLAVSLAANLFLGGIVAGHFGAMKMRPPPLFAPGSDTLFRMIPDRERRLMQERLHEQHEELNAAHRSLRTLHREIRAELGKEQPDRALLENKLAELRSNVQTLEQAMHVAFLETVLTLPTPERRQLMAEMRRPPPRGTHPRPDGPPPMPPRDGPPPP